MATKKPEPKKTETALALAAGSDLAFAQASVPDYIKQGSNRGSENVKQGDMILPRIEIVQSTSPIKDTNEDAKEGYLFNTVTQEVIGDHAYFVPIYFQVEFLIWKDQNEGGGFFGSFPSLEQAQERRNQVIQDGEDGSLIEIVDTPVHYGLRVTPDGSVCEQIVISMAKTKSKVSRKWNAMIQIAGGDRFGRVYKITTFKDENKKGQKFYNYVVSPAGFPPKAVYEMAEKTYLGMKSGEIKATADHSTSEPEDAASGEVDRGGI